ncbi:MAG: hypothetical protein P8126_02985 [Gammaproteobacteria bacterium]
MNSKSLVFTLVWACLLLAACSQSSSSGAASSADTPAAASSAETAGPCGGITASQAASILKIAPADVAGPQHLSTFSCVYRSRKDFYTSMTFNVYVEPSATQAHRKLNTQMEGLGNLSKIVAVDHLGDEAWRAPDPRVGRLMARKDNVWLDVVTPSDAVSQVRIARIVLAHVH